MPRITLDDLREASDRVGIRSWKGNVFRREILSGGSGRQVAAALEVLAKLVRAYAGQGERLHLDGSRTTR